MIRSINMSKKTKEHRKKVAARNQRLVNLRGESMNMLRTGLRLGYATGAQANLFLDKTSENNRRNNKKVKGEKTAMEYRMNHK